MPKFIPRSGSRGNPRAECSRRRGARARARRGRISDLARAHARAERTHVRSEVDHATPDCLSPQPRATSSVVLSPLPIAVIPNATSPLGSTPRRDDSVARHYTRTEKHVHLVSLESFGNFPLSDRVALEGSLVHAVHERGFTSWGTREPAMENV